MLNCLVVHEMGLLRMGNKQKVAGFLLMIALFLAIPQPIWAMPIWIEQGTGAPIEVEAELSDAVQQVKMKIQDKTGIDADQIRLLFTGGLLEDGRTLGDYPITSGATLQLELKPAIAPYRVQVEEGETYAFTEALFAMHYAGSSPLEQITIVTLPDSEYGKLQMNAASVTTDVYAGQSIDAGDLSGLRLLTYAGKPGTVSIGWSASDRFDTSAPSTIDVTIASRVADPGPDVVLSSNAKLDRLTVHAFGDEMELSPAFSSEILAYAAETKADQVELLAVSSDDKASMELGGKRMAGKTTIPLSIGDNALEIKVLAEDGSSRRYTIKIKRMAIQEEPSPTVAECSFQDIDGHWARVDICDAAEQGIAVGVSELTFAPDRPVTRMEFAEMLMRSLRIEIGGETQSLEFRDWESFPDGAQAALWTAVREKLLIGYPDGTLRPQQALTRTEAAVIVSRAMGWEIARGGSTTYADNSHIPAWAKAYVGNAQQHGLLVGRGDNRFEPDGWLTRAEAVAILLRLQ